MPVYDRLALAAGTRVAGPALLEQPDATVFVDPGLEGRVDAFGNLVDTLQPADLVVEKVANSAFYMTWLEWALRKAGIDRLFVCGIVTNGGFASTVRDAHVRDFRTVVLSDCYAAFSRAAHDLAIGDLSTVCNVTTCAEAAAAIASR